MVGFPVGVVCFSLLQNLSVPLIPSPPLLLIQGVKGKFFLELEWLEHEASHSYPPSSRVKNNNYEVTSPFHLVPNLFKRQTQSLCFNEQQFLTSNILHASLFYKLTRNLTKTI